MLKQFDIDSAKIACWVNNNDKQNIFFIHGSGSDHTAWSHQYARLNKKYNIVAVDLPGHGSSSGGGEADVGSYCLWIKKLLNILDLKNTVLVGHSLGAAVALRFSLDYPQYLAGIVLIGAGIKMPVNPFMLEFLKTNPAEIPPEILDLMCKFSLAKENRVKLSDPLRKSLSQSSVKVLYGDLSACNDLDLTEEICKINMPALIVCGAEDKMTPADFSRQLAACINGAKLEIIDGAGHMVMLEKPDEFNVSLDKFAALISAVNSGEG
ncbi:alpha/beta hydrolase fold [hydrocarbon metagenome]|uniref:Alpha/beta hydrolase fold n=1 Tax=hydrocarbon metagenome TaxID=938273 RepID=A0A0W8FLW7_9ZZZZ